jgi:5'-nucleotidase
MRILVSNDDGYFSPGIALLAERLATLGEVTVVAPERDRSGASNSLTLDRPLTVRRAANGFRYVNGTPTDCVHIARHRAARPLPDIVVSGHQLGANMGDDTIYSGTVAAAIEGFLLGIPSIAVSLASKAGSISTRAAASRQLVERFARAPITRRAAQRQRAGPAARGDWRHRGDAPGQRHKAEPVVQCRRRAARPLYWIGAAGGAQDAGPGHRLPRGRRGRVSVTPLQVDLTSIAQLPLVRRMAASERMRPAGSLAGIGMTSQRTRERMVERLREQGIATSACWRRWPACRATCSSRRRSPAAPTRTRALPIGFGQTISQPYVVARMIETLIREGTWQGAGGRHRLRLPGGGARAAAPEVYSIERIRRCWTARAPTCASCG